MAFYTFGDVWRQVLLHAPVVEPMLARAWVQWAYNQFCLRRGWSHLRGEGSLNVLVQRTGTCTFTQGSATVTGGGLVFTATDVGRQFKVGSVPVYTILAITAGGGTTATLDRVYAEASGAAVVGTVFSGYLTVPEDFQSFISVVDTSNKWRLRHWATQDQLNRFDAGRQSTGGNARVLASLDYSPVVVSLGLARYEVWPFQTTAKQYPIRYYKKPDNLDDTTPFIGPLSRMAPEVLLDGALSRCALWPGMEGRKNPYFSSQLAQTHRSLFEDNISKVAVKDDEMYFTTLPEAELPVADVPWDAAWLQSHEPSIIG